MGDALAWLHDAAADRQARGLHRTVVPRAVGDGALVDLAGNDYLGLSRHPDVVAAAVAALRGYGAGATASRLVTGTLGVHLDLERALAAHVGAEAALVFSSGYAANLGAVTALSGPGTLVVSDAGNHASLVDACRLSRARVRVVPTGDLAAVEQALGDRSEERALLVTDAVFSVTGALAPVGALHDIARRHGAALLVDEAHAVGVIGATGEGACATAGIAAEPDVVQTVTLSKALGSQGGAVVGSTAVTAHLADTARTFIFDTGLAPAAAAAALAALDLVRPERVAALRDCVTDLARLLDLPASDGAVLSVHVGDAAAAAAARDACTAAGLLVGCFRPPSVPAGGACLRLAARADLGVDDRRWAADVVRRSLVA